jgi:hypothetical protein
VWCMRYINFVLFLRHHGLPGEGLAPTAATDHPLCLSLCCAGGRFLRCGNRCGQLRMESPTTVLPCHSADVCARICQLLCLRGGQKKTSAPSTVAPLTAGLQAWKKMMHHVDKVVFAVLSLKRICSTVAKTTPH